MYKFIYSIFSTIFLSFFTIICMGFIIFAFVYCLPDGYSDIELLSLVLMSLLFGGLACSMLFFVNNYTFALITLTYDGIVKKKVFGKTIFIKWSEVNKIENGKAPDYISSYTDGYIVIYNKGDKQRKIILKKNIKIIEAFNKFIPKTLLENINEKNDFNNN